MDTFAQYLPDIDMADGVKRLMNNKKIYLTLLGKFKLREMADTLLEALRAGDIPAVSQAGHALRGTAANLGLPTLGTITGDIETLAKGGECPTHLAQPLAELVDRLVPAIAALIAAESAS